MAPPPEGPGARPQGFERQLQALHDQLERMRARAGQGRDDSLAGEALAELGVSLEELRVAEEELRAQADELDAQHALLDAERRRYRDLFELAPDGYLVTDPQGVIREANQAAAHLLNRVAPRLAGKPLAVYVAPSHLKSFRSFVTEMAHVDGLRRWQGQLIALARRPVDVECTVARNPRHSELRWHLHDVGERARAETELRQSRQNLRDLAGRIEAVREEERSRMAQEVHDELGSALTAVKMDIAAARHALERASAAPDQDALARIAAASNMIDETMDRIRRISMEMRPAVLDDFGLVAALDWQLTEFQKRTGLDCALNVAPGSTAVEPAKATAVFRIFQEILTNVARHAEARRVEVRLSQAGPDLVLDVRDDGRGIRPEEANGSQSLGLLGMRERARLHGGRFEIEGSPDYGTQVRVSVPVGPSE